MGSKLTKELLSLPVRGGAESPNQAADEALWRLAAIVESSDDAIVSKDLNGIIQSWNAGAERVFGYRAEEVVGKPITILIPPEFENEEPNILARIRRGERIDHYETIRRRKDGSAIQISLTVSPVRDSSGRIIGASKIARDITERKRSEQRVAMQAAVNRVLADAPSLDKAASAILRTICQCADWQFGNLWLRDRKAQQLTWIQDWHAPDFAWPELAAASRARTFARGEGVPGRVWAEGNPIWIPDLQKDPNFLRAAGAAGVVSGFAFPISAENEVLGVMEFFGRSVRVADGNLTQIANVIGGQVGQFLERKRAERALEEKTRNLEALNRVGSTLVAELNLERIAQSVIEAGREISGAAFGAFFYNVPGSEAETGKLCALASAPRDAFPSMPMPAKTDAFATLFRGDGVVRIGDALADPRFGKEAPFYGLAKSPTAVRSYLAVPVISRSGGVLGGLFFGHPERDVFTEASERVLLALASQAAMALDNANLYGSLERELAAHKRAEDALRESEEALRQAQQELKRHNEGLEFKVQERTTKLLESLGELEAFSYSVSHDMRAPLRAMQGFSDALVREYDLRLDDQGRDYLRRINRAARRLDMLIQDVLTYSRIAKQDLMFRPLDLDKFLPEVLQSYPNLDGSKANIKVEQPLGTVLAHEALLSQVLANLLGNALKFVKPGEVPQVRVCAEGEGEWIRVSIVDNGLGIAPEHRQRIFQIFGRVYSDKKFEGTGIGLAIVKKAVERMNGQVGVESALGKGSRFWFTLPRA